MSRTISYTIILTRIFKFNNNNNNFYNVKIMSKTKFIKSITVFKNEAAKSTQYIHKTTPIYFNQIHPYYIV